MPPAWLAIAQGFSPAVSASCGNLFPIISKRDALCQAGVRMGGFRSLRRASNRAPPCWISRGLLKKAGENFPFVWDYDSDLLLMCATAVGTGAPFT